MSELLTLKQAGKLLFVSERTVQRLIANRQLKVVKVGRKPLVTLAELDRYVKSRERLA